MITIAQMTPTELAGLVGDSMGKHGIDVVLSGGACVAYYSEQQKWGQSKNSPGKAQRPWWRLKSFCSDLGPQFIPEKYDPAPLSSCNCSVLPTFILVRYRYPAGCSLVINTE